MTNEEMKQHVTPEVTNEILDHMMNPRNYGNLEDLNCAGVAYDDETDEFVSMYMVINNGIIEMISFGTNGCTDTVVAGSIFTEMIKGDTVVNAKAAKEKMMEKLQHAPEQLRICSTMVLLSCDACWINYENRAKGQTDELFKMSMQESCQGLSMPNEENKEDV
ncbi:MAG: iron-sulfur cluster assembly scaffold protein [Campylobacterota bacterium]|nr:iron-sulfur cluster assembly scaffold protein [Campylobacterota bacterium]